jgi:hypothetical protein
MTYSLLNKFRGAWLGGCLGAGISKETPASPWGQIAKLGAKSLIKLGYLDLDHWQEEVAADPALLKLIGTAKSSEVVWAVLPVILFYHEQPQKLAPQLLSAINFWQIPPASPQMGLALGATIALLLGENPQLHHLIDRSNLRELLGLPETFWQELPCLELALKEINFHTPKDYRSVAIACYSFLSTPQDFRLSIQRSVLPPPAGIAPTLTGILSGAYNSLSSIPLHWYWQNLELATNQQEIIDNLFAGWSGVYQMPKSEDRTNPRRYLRQVVTVPFKG